jgi:hypothetical protein
MMLTAGMARLNLALPLVQGRQPATAPDGDSPSGKRPRLLCRVSDKSSKTPKNANLRRFHCEKPKNISKTLESSVKKKFYTPDFRDNFVPKSIIKMKRVDGKYSNRKFVKIVALHPCTSPDSREGRNHSAGTIPRP